MGMRFQKRIQILPWVWLNISKSGFSFSFGPPGLSVNLGSKGPKVTAGIPGTGLSYSQRIGSPAGSAPTLGSREVALAEADKTIAEIDSLLKECRFAQWIENYLEPLSVSVTPLYSRGVALTLIHNRLSTSFLMDRLNIPESMADTIIALMAYDGIQPSDTNPEIPASKMDIVALWNSFEIFDRQQ